MTTAAILTTVRRFREEHLSRLMLDFFPQMLDRSKHGGEEKEREAVVIFSHETQGRQKNVGVRDQILETARQLSLGQGSESLNLQ